MPEPPAVIVALLIGELHYQAMNAITRQIVEQAATLWKQHPTAMLVCETERMRALAQQFGVASDRLVTALPQDSGQTTRKLASWLAAHRSRFSLGSIWIVTHRFHATRAARMFRACGLDVRAIDVAAPFHISDPDWKLQSEWRFRLYNTGAAAYCWLRGWL